MICNSFRNFYLPLLWDGLSREIKLSCSTICTIWLLMANKRLNFSSSSLCLLQSNLEVNTLYCNCLFLTLQDCYYWFWKLRNRTENILIVDSILSVSQKIWSQRFFTRDSFTIWILKIYLSFYLPPKYKISNSNQKYDRNLVEKVDDFLNKAPDVDTGEVYHPGQSWEWLISCWSFQNTTQWCL